MTQTDKQAHTPGKRVVRGTRVGVIDERDGVLIMTAKAFSGTGSTLAEQEANARRVAACENACEGISTEALEAGVVADLLTACERVVEMATEKGVRAVKVMMTSHGKYSAATVKDDSSQYIRAVKAAIAKARAS